MNKILICSLVWVLLNVGPAWAGEKIAVECTNPGCDYTKNLSLGGSRRSPAITCYCAQCRDFVRLKLQDWDQYYDQKYYCPTCDRAATPIYSHQDITNVPCPRCGRMTLKTKTLRRYD
jgi:hypothetical protein